MYKILEKYSSKCSQGYHYHPGHPKSDKNGCMKDTDMAENYHKNMIEKYGTFSIYGALKTPIRYDNFYYQGVS